MTQPKLAIEISNLTKKFGDFTALNDISLNIIDNEFFTLLGPSGCGKTTLLRLIAGFETISAGEMLLYGEPIQDLPANKRPINTVFQNYALFPHKNVFDNIKFGLEMLGKDKDYIEARTEKVIELVQLSEFKARKPSQLSGGQQQRVALARALAPEPKLLLLDESLSALDLKLREQMRHELKQIQRETGITFIFVTHDQDEALTMSDRIAVISSGRIQQIGCPEDIYQRPANKFVADFIGETTLLPVTIKAVKGNEASCLLQNGDTVSALISEGMKIDDKVLLSIRPEHITILQKETGDSMKARIHETTYSGASTQIQLMLKSDEMLSARITDNYASEAMKDLKIGDDVFVQFQTGRARLLKA